MNHSFNIQDACDYDPESAIIIQDFGKWIFYKKTNGENLHDGRTWIFNSKKALAEQFPYWSEKQLRRIIDGLLKTNVLLSGNYNEDRRDHTLWYAFQDEGKYVDRWFVEKKPKSDLPKRAKGNAQTGNSISPNGQNSFAQTGTSDLPKRADDISTTQSSTQSSTQENLYITDDEENEADQTTETGEPAFIPDHANEGAALVPDLVQEPSFENWQGVEPTHENSIRILYGIGINYQVVESELLGYLKDRHEQQYMGWVKNWNLPDFVPEFCKQHNCVEFAGLKHLNNAIRSMGQFYQQHPKRSTTGIKTAKNEASAVKPELKPDLEQLRAMSVNRFQLKNNNVDE